MKYNNVWSLIDLGMKKSAIKDAFGISKYSQI